MKKKMITALAFLLILSTVFSSIGMALPVTAASNPKPLEGNVVSTITDVSMTVGRNAVDGCLGNSMRVLTTESGTYGVYMVSENYFKNVGNGAEAINEFAFVKLDGDVATLLATGHTIHGEVDLMADASGEIYIVGGGNYLRAKRATNHPAALPIDESVEHAVLSVWHYNQTSGALDGYTTNSYSFDQPGDYQYVTAVMDNAEHRIQMLFQGESGSQQYLSWFVFDLNTYQWTGGAKTAAVSSAVGDNYAFSQGNGSVLIFADRASAGIHSINIPDMEAASVEESTVISGNVFLCDAYMDRSGAMHLLYRQDGILYHHFAGNASELAIADGTDVRMVQNKDGALYILAMPENENAALQIYASADGTSFVSVYEHTFPKVVAGSNSSFRQPKAPFAVSTLRNGSLQGNTFGVMFPANFFGSPDWHYFAVDFDGNAGSGSGTDPGGDALKFNASQFGKAPSFEKITAESWGEKTATAISGARNCGLLDKTTAQYLKDMYMDLYLRWDADYLYIGIETNELDSYMPCLGGDESWKGDALQFMIDPMGPGETPSAKAMHIAYGFNEAGEACVWDYIVAEGYITEQCKTGFYQEDGKEQFMIAIPASIILNDAAGKFSADTELGLSILRWSGEAGVGDYNGGLTWGAGIAPGMFTMVEASNSVTLAEELAVETGSIKVNASQFGKAPSFEKITAESWGEKTATAISGARNCGLVDKTTAQYLKDMYMDLYLRWDADYLYIGVETNELDSYMACLGGDESWKGDALQFMIDPMGPGETPSAKAMHIAYGFNEAGEACVWDYIVAEGYITEQCKTGFYQEDGKEQFMIAIPASIILNDAAGKFSADTELGLSILRWSGEAGVGDYNGGLTWGAGIAPGMFTMVEASNSVTLKGM